MARSLVAKVSLESAAAEAELGRLRAGHPGLVIQMASMEELPPLKAVQMIVDQTLRARVTGALIASKPEVDLLLRLAGTSQIAVAIAKTGHQAAGTKMLVVGGPPRGIAKLKGLLLKDRRYRLVEGGKLGAEGMAMVERAALLGTML